MQAPGGSVHMTQNSNKHTMTHTVTYTHMHTRMRTRVHTHTHTHTRSTCTPQAVTEKSPPQSPPISGGVNLRGCLASYPGSRGRGKGEPGINCMRMRLIKSTWL